VASERGAEDGEEGVGVSGKALVAIRHCELLDTNQTNKKTIEPCTGEILSPGMVRLFFVGLIRVRSGQFAVQPFASSRITSIAEAVATSSCNCWTRKKPKKDESNLARGRNLARTWFDSSFFCFFRARSWQLAWPTSAEIRPAARFP
jgi:hypothetical protein